MIRHYVHPNKYELEDAKILEILKAANTQNRVKILDEATGPNEFNKKLTRALISRGIEYKLVLSDISPSQLKRGYENLKDVLTDEEMKNIKLAIVDSNNLKKEITKPKLFLDIHVDEKIVYENLENILLHKDYQFLLNSYAGLKRLEKFKSNSFSIVTGDRGYTSMRKYDKAINEAVRILKPGGYHIINDVQVKKINKNIKRTPGAMRGAKIKHVEDLKLKLDQKLKLVSIHSTTYRINTDYYDPDETIQNEDEVLDVVLVHKKV